MKPDFLKYLLKVMNTLPEWQKDAVLKITRFPEEAMEMRLRATDDLYYFARLVNPGYAYGSIHREIFQWMQDYSLYVDSDEVTSNKLIMLPRAHLKSHMVAVWVAWITVRHPEVTILYVSATADLAMTQLYAVQNILTSTVFRRYFPEYINPQEGSREKWSSSAIIIDHPKRKEEGVRDATVKTAGLTTNTTGWHADIVVGDDLVVPENAYTQDGRTAVANKSSQFTSIRNAGGFTMACGTRYHPKDVYATWKEQTYPVFNEHDEIVDKKPIWSIKEYVVETDGIFLWPRTVRPDGKAFGFNRSILGRIEGEYEDRVQFYSQYYNDPNDPGSERISRDKFQYYNPGKLRKEGRTWKYLGRRLNIYAAVDFAFSLNKKADFTAIVVIGVDHESNVYVLDIDRFKTDKTYEYFKKIARLHSKWCFKKLRAEVTQAQQVITQAIKDHVREEGLSLPIDEFRPSRTEGTKEERIKASLEHRYEGMKMYHFEGGYTQVLEDELVKARPPHDDVKDALASAVDIANPPASPREKGINDFMQTKTKSRFGGKLQ